MVDDFGRSDWEDSVTKSGKFVEAALKAIATHCGVAFGSGRNFKADTVINALGQLPSGSQDDSLRITIPRACRIVYDIASNRGARHDPDEIDPNSMDANLAVSTCSWILAEMVRYAQKNAVDPSQAVAIVEALIEKKYPSVEEVEGRVYFHAKKKSAPDTGLVILARRYPKKIERSELILAISRNGFTRKNAEVAVRRITKYLDKDGSGGLRLLNPGLKRAEELIYAETSAGSKESR